MLTGEALIEALLPCVLEAGRIIMRHRIDGVACGKKADRSVVTAADHDAEAIILAALATFAPGVPVVAEEESAAGRQPAASARFFLVDPLDGTREYVAGGDDFTVNIALVETGAPVLGIVHAPASGTIYWGDVAARAAFRADVADDGTIGEPIAIVCAPGAAGLRAVASRSHGSPPTEAYLAACGAADRLSIGSSLKFLLVADGRADLYPRAGPTMEWDTAAGDAVLRAAGGMTFDLDGAPLGYGKPHYFNPGFVAAGRCAAPVLGPYYPDRQTAPAAYQG